jgi:septal ring factor EnvC (AmiA/AmiB activator)
MWPKLLFDLLPHFARLMPMADKYLAGRSASDKAQEAALAAFAADLRGELGQSTQTQAGIQRQLQEQNTQLAAMSVEVTRTRMGMESAEARIAKLEKSFKVVIALLAAVLVLVAMVFAILVVRKV